MALFDGPYAVSDCQVMATVPHNAYTVEIMREGIIAKMLIRGWLICRLSESHNFRILSDMSKSICACVCGLKWHSYAVSRLCYGLIVWRHVNILASQTTRNSAPCSTTCQGYQQKKRQPLVLLWEIYWYPVDSHRKGQVMQKSFMRSRRHADVSYRWLSERLQYLHCLRTGNTTVLH